MSLTAHNEDLCVILNAAIREGNRDVFEALLQVVAYVNASSREIPIVVAAQCGNLAFLTELVDIADIDDTGYDERTALFAAVQSQQMKCVQLLIESGADVDLTCNGDTALAYAAREGLVEYVRVLAKGCEEIDAKDVYGLTPLAIAAERGHVDCVKLLLEEGAQIHPEYRSWRIPLHRAAENGHVDCCEALLDDGALPDHACEAGYTALMSASSKGQVDVVKLLVARGARVSAQHQNGTTALFWAINHTDNHECVQELLRLGADCNKADFEGRTPVFVAATYGAVKVLSVLIEAGAHLNVRNEFRRTPVHSAVNGNECDCLRMLLKNGALAQTNVPGDNQPLLFAVGEEGSAAATELLLQFGASPDTSHHGRGAIHIAACCEHAACLQALIKAGANLTTETEDFELPLMCSNNPACLEILLKAGANLEMRNSLGQTPLLRAVEYNRITAVKYFLEQGANTEACMDHGRTALISAAAAGHCTCVSLLLESGANVDSIDQHGRTALVWAAMKDDLRCVELLLDSGARFCVKDRRAKTILLRLVYERTSRSAPLLRKHLVKQRLQMLRGLLRFLVVVRRYRENFHRDEYIRIGSRNFGKRRLQLKPQTRQLEPGGSNTSAKQNCNFSRTVSAVGGSADSLNKRLRLS